MAAVAVSHFTNQVRFFSEVIECDACDGEGAEKVHFWDWDGCYYQTEYDRAVNCRQCHGTGQIIR